MCFPVTDPGVRPPPLSDLTLVWDKFLHRIDRNVYDFLKCLVCLTKSALHFATKLNSKAASFTIQEFKYTIRGQGIITCNCDWWERVWGCNLPQKSSTVLSEPKFGPPCRPQSNIPGSAPAFAGNIKRVYKRAEYSFHQLIRLGRLEIHIALSAQHRCRNPR